MNSHDKLTIADRTQAKLVALFRSGRNGKKCLDKIDRLLTNKWGSQMRNCYLHRDGERLWRVTFHGNDIVRIDTSGGAARGTVWNVEKWPTLSAAQRLTSALGIYVIKKQRRLWGLFSNFRDFIPLASGLEFELTPTGNVICTTPEMSVVTKRVVNREKAKPICKHLRQLKKLAKLLAKLGALSVAETRKARLRTPYFKTRDIAEALKEVIVNDYIGHLNGDTPGISAVQNMLQFGVYSNNVCLYHDDVESFIKAGVDAARNLLYTKYGVYETKRLTALEMYQ